MVRFNPKERFLANTNRVALWREMTARTEFLELLDDALLAYQERVLAGGGADIGPKLGGAREFIGELINLGLKPEIPEKKPTPNLNQKT